MNPVISIYVLCHKHLDLAKRALQSVLSQRDTGFAIYPNLMVNTNNLDLFEEAKDTLTGSLDDEDLITVLHSWSNGATGAGKNACTYDWLDNNDTDWMMILDGDDWLYPHALWHIEQFLAKDPTIDYLGLQSMDMLYSTPLNGRQIISKDPELYLSTWDQRQENLTKLYPRRLWMKDLVKRHSVARILLTRRQDYMDNSYTLSPEDMLMYEDMVVNARLLCAMQHGTKFVNINCSGIYIADSTVKGMSETNIYKYDHQTPYEYHVRPLEEHYGNINFDEIPFIEIPLHPSVNMLEKIDYIIKTYE